MYYQFQYLRRAASAGLSPVGCGGEGAIFMKWEIEQHMQFMSPARSSFPGNDRRERLAPTKLHTHCRYYYDSALNFCSFDRFNLPSESWR